MKPLSFEREHLWRCRTRREAAAESGPKYFLSRDSTIESLEEAVAVPDDFRTKVSVVLPAEYLGRIGNYHPLLDGKLMYEERERWAEETIRLEREAYMRIVHGA